MALASVIHSRHQNWEQGPGGLTGFFAGFLVVFWQTNYGKFRETEALHEEYKELNQTDFLGEDDEIIEHNQ